jgi:isocitrate dehydrogenase
VTEKSNIKKKDIIGLLEKLSNAGFDFIKAENLYEYGGEKGYSSGQGE